jgi:hypothetical protein
MSNYFENLKLNYQLYLSAKSLFLIGDQRKGKFPLLVVCLICSVSFLNGQERLEKENQVQLLNIDNSISQEMADCEGQAGMIFINKNRLCGKVDLLNPNRPDNFRKVIKEFKGQEKDYLILNKDNVISIRKSIKSCNGANDKYVSLSGYYIVPAINGYPEYDHIIDSNTNVNLLFFPVWNYIQNSTTYEVVCNPINLTSSYHTLATTSASADLSGVVLSASAVIATSAINHTYFQYHNEAMNDDFERAFISYYEFKSILDHCEYLGITGALINTGILVPQSFTDDEPETLESSCPNVYFTYRFIGFKKATRLCPNNPNGICLQKANTIIKFEKDGSSEVEFNHSIPAESWAVPCPPMWRPY